MKMIIRAMSERAQCINYLRKHLPSRAEFLIDVPGNAMDAFLAALRAAGTGPAVHMEEDIFLTRDFEKKLMAAINERPDEVIQFFSRRKKDTTIGSRYESGGSFVNAQCFYLPADYSRQILDYYDIWEGKAEHPTGLDLMVADWLKGRREKYWIHVPSLVQHRTLPSLIDSRRSTKRQSQTFEECQL